MRAILRKACRTLPLLLLPACQPANGNSSEESATTSLSPPITSPGSSQVTHRVLIRFDPETRRFSYVDPKDTTRSLNPVYAMPGDRIEWSSQQGPWAVHHGPLTPFRVIHIQGRPGEWAGAYVWENTPYGKYRYFVAVEIRGTIWMDDPEDMVGPGR